MKCEAKKEEEHVEINRRNEKRIKKREGGIGRVARAARDDGEGKGGGCPILLCQHNKTSHFRCAANLT